MVFNRFFNGFASVLRFFSFLTGFSVSLSRFFKVFAGPFGPKVGLL